MQNDKARYRTPTDKLHISSLGKSLKWTQTVNLTDSQTISRMGATRNISDISHKVWYIKIHFLLFQHGECLYKHLENKGSLSKCN